MTAFEIITRFHARGIILSRRGDRLRVEAPLGVLTEADRALLAARKADLLAALLDLGAETPPPSLRHYDGPTPPCPWCGGPTHDALDHLPGIVVLLCDDAEVCRWGLVLTPRELAEWLRTGRPPAEAGRPARGDRT